MSRRVIWTRRAQRDLQEQLEFIALDKPDASVRIGIRVIETAELLGQWAQIGKGIPGKKDRELVIPSTPYVLLYRDEGDRIRVLRLMHGAQRH